MGMQTDFDAMTDEEFANASDDLPTSEPIETEEEVIEEESNVEPDGEEEDSGTDDEAEDTQDDDGNADEDSDDSEDDAGESEGEDDEEETDDSDGNEEDSEDTDFDFESGYKDILKPFKANGKEMQVDSVDDVRQLMQMGAGFSKKMQKLKPHLKIVKALKDNGLLDQSKLDNLIELSQGNPEAIAKLLKDNEIDPLDIELDGAGEYKAKSHEISDSAFNLDEAIENIRGTEGFDKSMDVMGNQWDSKSRGIIADNPDIVNVINDHVQSGVFEAVQNHVEKERALGRMEGVSDVEAYREAVNALQESGALIKDSTPNTNKSKSKGNSLEQEAGKAASKRKAAKAKAKKRAAAPSKGGKTSGSKKADLSDLSDEDFLKEFEKL